MTIYDENASNNMIIIVILCLVFGFLCGMLVGYFTLNMVKEKEEVVAEEPIVNDVKYSVIFNGEEQTFRDSDGHRVKVKEEDGVLYLPITEKGLFFDYDIKVEGNEIIVSDYEKPSIVSFDTITLKGNRFTSESFYNYDYTLFLNWDTWCHDCMKLLEKMAENKEVFEKLNMQIIGVPYISADTNLFELDAEVEKIMNEKGISFVNILTTTEIENLVQTNLTNIPTIVIVDNKGRVLTKNTDVEIDLSALLENIHTFDICSSC